MAKSKWGKTILGLAAVGGAIAAGALYLTKKNKCDECEECDVDFEDEDFDLDSDLKPADRGYVSLTPSVDEEKTDEADDATDDAEEKADDAVEENTETITEE